MRRIRSNFQNICLFQYVDPKYIFCVHFVEIGPVPDEKDGYGHTDMQNLSMNPCFEPKVPQNGYLIRVLGGLVLRRGFRHHESSNS